MRRVIGIASVGCLIASAAAAQTAPAAPQPRAVNRTVYTRTTELFAEWRPLVVGQATRLTAHLTHTGDRFRPYAPGDARAAARRDMGGLSQVRDAYRDQHCVPVFETIWRNSRFAVRASRGTPGLTATIVLTLALGIGANSAVFSAIDTVLLRPLSFPDADELVRVIQTQDGARDTWIAPLRLEDWNRLSSSFAAITGYAVEDSSDTTGDLPVRVRRARVSPRFVQVWGVAPAVGRGFTDAEHRLGASSVALISDRYWRNRFGARSERAGQERPPERPAHHPERITKIGKHGAHSRVSL